MGSVAVRDAFVSDPERESSSVALNLERLALAEMVKVLECVSVGGGVIVVVLVGVGVGGGEMVRVPVNVLILLLNVGKRVIEVNDWVIEISCEKLCDIEGENVLPVLDSDRSAEGECDALADKLLKESVDDRDMVIRFERVSVRLSSSEKEGVAGSVAVPYVTVKVEVELKLMVAEGVGGTVLVAVVVRE